MPKTILVVEDDQDLRELLIEFLEEEGFQVKSAANGKTAVNSLKNALGCFDLIITDVEMPEMGGEIVLSAARENHRNLPVIVMKAFVSREEVNEFKQKGAFAVLSKPASLSEIFEIVQSALNLSR